MINLMKRVAIIQIFPLCALFLLMAGCAGMLEETVQNWHQHYEPIENKESLEFIDMALEEAQRFAGPSFLPVNEVHLRQSITRKHPARLSRADILDWNLFVETLLTKQSHTPWDSIWHNLSLTSRQRLEDKSPIQGFPIADQLVLLTDLNTLIQSRTFYDKNIFAPVR